MTILAYDAVGLIYYAWKKNGKVNTINDFSFKGKIKGKIIEIKADAITRSQEGEFWSLRFPRFKTFRGFKYNEKI